MRPYPRKNQFARKHDGVALDIMRDTFDDPHGAWWLVAARTFDCTHGYIYALAGGYGTAVWNDNYVARWRAAVLQRNNPMLKMRFDAWEADMRRQGKIKSARRAPADPSAEK